MFVTNSYQNMLSIRLWFVIWKASSFAISAFNSVHVSEAYSSDDSTDELSMQNLVVFLSRLCLRKRSSWDIMDEAKPIFLRIFDVQ